MFHRLCSVLLRKARQVFKVVYWTVSLTCILGVAFVASPDGYVRLKAWRESHVVVSVSGDSRIRDLAKTLTSWDFAQIDCLTKNAYFEARGEGLDGVTRVINVVLNRASNHIRYPDGPCQVITEPRQFSWYSDGKDHTIRDFASYNAIYTISYNLYVYRKAGVLKDNTDGARHYHADYVHPKWPWQRLGQWGHHIFYK